MTLRLLHLVLLVALSQKVDHQLLGSWRYIDCTIKNTSMEGTVTFYSDGSFELNAIGHDDCPVPSLSGKFHYQTKEGKFFTDYRKGYGFSTYYLVEKGYLYFSERKIFSARESFDEGYLKANWQYKLVKVEGSE